MTVAETVRRDIKKDNDNENSFFSTPKMNPTLLNFPRNLNLKMPTRFDFATPSNIPSLSVFFSILVSNKPHIRSGLKANMVFLL